MRVRHTKLLSLLFSLTTILLHAGEIPTDTLLAHFYNRAANLMEEGHYDEAQRIIITLIRRALPSTAAMIRFKSW